MTITATIVADSISPAGQRLSTMSLRYPRMIHSEFMTHRVFSRNASSSRAIPIERMIQDVIDDPAMPVAWGSNKPGMQAGDEIETTAVWQTFGEKYWGKPKEAWLYALGRAVEVARGLAVAGYHKQIVNRLLEPFAHISVVVTATEWDNFFALRCHPDADPTMRALADAMRDAMEGSEPHLASASEWHLPYITEHDVISTREYLRKLDPDRKEGIWNGNLETLFAWLARISAARCARVSYLTHDGSKPDVGKDIALASRLLESRHMSPFEHQARITGDDGTALWGNLVGWDQFRKMVEA